MYVQSRKEPTISIKILAAVNQLIVSVILHCLHYFQRLNCLIFYFSKTKIYDVFGLASRKEEGESGKPGAKVLPSYFINRVANGNERRTAVTEGAFYVDLKLYATKDAQDTDSLDLWKKAQVRIKFHTDENSEQWGQLYNFVRSVDSIFKEEPKFFSGD